MIQRAFALAAAMVILAGAVGVAMAEEGWVDVTKEVRALEASKGGWGKPDEGGKALRSPDGNQVKIVTSKFGTYRLDCPTKTLYKVEDGKETKVEDALLINRQHGLMLVIKTSKVKIRVSFKEVVEGLNKHIGGLTPQG